MHKRPMWLFFWRGQAGKIISHKYLCPSRVIKTFKSLIFPHESVVNKIWVIVQVISMTHQYSSMSHRYLRLSRKHKWTESLTTRCDWLLLPPEVESRSASSFWTPDETMATVEPTRLRPKEMSGLLADWLQIACVCWHEAIYSRTGGGSWQIGRLCLEIDSSLLCHKYNDVVWRSDKSGQGGRWMVLYCVIKVCVCGGGGQQQFKC